jgi:hypothetical protein
MADIVTLTATLLKRAVEGLSGQKAEIILQAAMAAAHDNNYTFMLVKEEDKLKAAIGAAFLVMNEEDKERVCKELAVLKAINAATQGVPVNFAALCEPEEGYQSIDINKLWEESKKAHAEKIKKGRT